MRNLSREVAVRLHAVGKKGPNSAGHTFSFIAAYCEGMESDKRKDFTLKNDENVQKRRPVEDLIDDDDDDDDDIELWEVINQTVSPKSNSGIFVCTLWVPFPPSQLSELFFVDLFLYTNILHQMLGYQN